MMKYTKPEILKALKGSIRKWQKIVAGTGYDDGIDNCPLCTLFYKQHCIGCPVRDRTGESYCEGTPYGQWTFFQDVHMLVGDSKMLLTAKKLPKGVLVRGQQLAQHELDFLKSLLSKRKIKQ